MMKLNLNTSACLYLSNQFLLCIQSLVEAIHTKSSTACNNECLKLMTLISLNHHYCGSDGTL